MARTRSDKFEDIQREILGHAAKVFGRMGYERSSISDLIEEGNLSRGALYHYFQSKEAILFALLDSHVRGLLKRLEDALAEDGAPVDQLARAIETIVEYNAGSVDEQVILLNDLGSLGKADQQSIIKLERKVVELVADCLVRVDTSGRITKATKSVYTMMLFGILNFMHTWYDPSKGVKPKELARRATDLFLNGLLSAPREMPKPRNGTETLPTRIKAGRR